MSDDELIRDYLVQERGISDVVAERILEKVTKYDDIKAEFVKWLKTREYKTENPVMVEGYTAESLHGLTEVINGVGIYNFLVDLRDNPEQAKKTITAGFPVR